MSNLSQKITLSIARDEPFAGGAEFGSIGAYRRIEGRAHLAIAPHEIGADGLYFRDAIETGTDGLIHAVSAFWMLVPAEPARGNGTLLFELPNRGSRRLLHTYNHAPMKNSPQSLADAGDGWLMREGYSLVASAWQGDVLGGNDRMTIDLPGYSDDAPTSVAYEYVVYEQGVRCLPLSGVISTRSYPAASLDTSKARLTRRRYPDSACEEIAADAWAFERIDSSPGGPFGFPPPEEVFHPSQIHIHVFKGFQPGWIYELEYDATGALALDIGLVGIGELVSVLRHAVDGNPLAGSVERTIAVGRSQCGRALREFIYRGFNRDSRGMRIFDGVLPHISGAGRIQLNRYENLNLSGAHDYNDHNAPSDRFPFSYAQSTDHLTGKEDAIMKRPDTDPKLIHTQTSAEYWHRRASLTHTDTQGRDLEQPDNVRFYTWAGAHHAPAMPPMKPVRGPFRELMNNVITAPLDAAVLTMMQAWLKDGISPPTSRVPNASDGTLVSADQYRTHFPAIPGSTSPMDANPFPLLDYGPELAEGYATPITPQANLGDYTVLVPAADDNGNEIGGVLPPMLQAPLGTYTGWNLRAAGHAQGKLFSFMGSYIPFPENEEEKAFTGDPRPAILSLYPTEQDYTDAIVAAARKLQDEGFMLESGVRQCAAFAAHWGAVNHVHAL